MSPGEQQELLTLAALLREGLLAEPLAPWSETDRRQISRAVAKRAQPKGQPR